MPPEQILAQGPGRRLAGGWRGEDRARARGRRGDRPREGGAGGELRAVRVAHERSRRLDVALREVLDREARFARPPSVPARGVPGMEQAKLADKPALAPRRTHP